MRGRWNKHNGPEIREVFHTHGPTRCDALTVVRARANATPHDGNVRRLNTPERLRHAVRWMVNAASPFLPCDVDTPAASTEPPTLADVPHAAKCKHVPSRIDCLEI